MANGINIEVIDFDGEFENGFITQGFFSWKPILQVDNWEPIEKVEDKQLPLEWGP